MHVGTVGTRTPSEGKIIIPKAANTGLPNSRLMLVPYSSHYLAHCKFRKSPGNEPFSRATSRARPQFENPYQSKPCNLNQTYQHLAHTGKQISFPNSELGTAPNKRIDPSIVPSLQGCSSITGGPCLAALRPQGPGFSTLASAGLQGSRTSSSCNVR